MKTEIKVAVSYVKVTHQIKEVDLPEETKFYVKGDIKSDYLGDIELFAIILKGKPTSGWYTIASIKRDHQIVTDFIPRKDVTSEFWVDGNGMRKKALTIIEETGSKYPTFLEISEDEFKASRNILLDVFLKEI